MHIQVFYDNGDYETFDTPPMPYDNGAYTVENNYLRLSSVFFAPAAGDMKMSLERCFWSAVPENEEDNQKESKAWQVDYPSHLLEPRHLEGVLAIVVDGIVMAARCDGILRHWFDPEFVNPMAVGFDMEQMTGGWSWPETQSIGRTEGASFKPSPMAPNTNSEHTASSDLKVAEVEAINLYNDTDTNSTADGITVSADDHDSDLSSLEALYPGLNDEVVDTE